MTRDDADILESETVWQGFFRVGRLRNPLFDGGWRDDGLRDALKSPAMIRIAGKISKPGMVPAPPAHPSAWNNPMQRRFLRVSAVPTVSPGTAARLELPRQR